MPEFYFFFNEQDEQSLVRFMLDEMGLAMVPNIGYGKEKYIELNDVESYGKRDFVRKYGDSYFLIRDDFTKCPLKMHRISGKKLGDKYFISPKEDAQALDIYFDYPQKIQSKRRFVATCSVSHYPNYWNTHTGQYDKASDDLKQAYKEIVKFIKKNGFPCEPVIRERKWAGKHAVEEYLEGRLEFRWGEHVLKPVIK